MVEREHVAARGPWAADGAADSAVGRGQVGVLPKSRVVEDRGSVDRDRWSATPIDLMGGTPW